MLVNSKGQYFDKGAYGLLIGEIRDRWGVYLVNIIDTITGSEFDHETWESRPIREKSYDLSPPMITPNYEYIQKIPHKPSPWPPQFKTSKNAILNSVCV